MFINFWYAAAQSAELTDKPLKVRMLGHDFVVFRDSKGQAHCLSNVCAHRGGSLGQGKTKGDCIECPYHGWQYNSQGECVRIPSLGADAKIPARTRIDSYPVHEKYGLVFAFLGDLPEAERPPILEIPEYGQPGWRATIQTMDWNIDYKRSIENGIDPAHNAFVHDTHIAKESPDYGTVSEMKFTDTAWGTGFWNTTLAPPPAEARMRATSGRTGSATVDVGTGHHGPNHVWTYIHPTPQMMIHQYLYETPREDDRTRLYLVTLRNFIPTPEYDAKMIERNAYVANQDGHVLEQLQPVLTPRTNVHEMFMPTDLPVAKYRDFCKAWEAKGWRIDVEKMRANRHETAFAIPSPARRATKGWVIEAVPMIAASPAAAAAE